MTERIIRYAGQDVTVLAGDRHHVADRDLLSQTATAPAPATATTSWTATAVADSHRARAAAPNHATAVADSHHARARRQPLHRGPQPPSRKRRSASTRV